MGDQRQKLSPAAALGVLLRNILLSRRPLYGLAEWTQRLSEWNRAIVSVLSQTRRDVDVSQEALAKAMGWHCSKVVKVEAAKTSLRAAELIVLATVLKIDPRQLLDRILRWNSKSL